MPDIAELKVPLKLGGQLRHMMFDLNTFAAYQEKTGRSFLADAADLLHVFEPGLIGEQISTPARPPSGLEVIAAVPMDRLKMLLWASIHDYDRDDEPVWPLTPGKIGREITLGSIPEIFGAFLRGNSGNLPEKQILGESQGSETTTTKTTALPTSPAEPNASESTGSDGGTTPIALDEGAFALPAANSGG